MKALPGVYPLSRTLILSMIAVAIIPVVLVVAHLSWSSWDSRWQEVQQRHQLLAGNLATPVSTLIRSQQQALALLADNLLVLQSRGLSSRQLHQQLERAQGQLPAIQHIAWLSLDGRSRFQTTSRAKFSRVMSRDSTFNHVIKSMRWRLSGIKTSPFTGKPGILLGQPIVGTQGDLRGVLLAEIRLEQIETLRHQVQFDESGYAVVIDQHGHLVAHPNPAWVAQMKNVSDWPFVPALISGEQGTAEFILNDEQSMLAGFVPLNGLGWGIVVLQPASDISVEILSLIGANLLWSIFALLLAIGIALALACWITRPINSLLWAAQQLLARDLQGELQFDVSSAPKEIHSLGLVLATVVSRLQHSRQEVQVLNKGLQERVQRATEALRKSNAQLKKQVRRDYLTALPNRRFFETNFQEIFHRRRDDAREVCLMLIDVDHFKDINDQYGHAAGDRVLSEIASTLDGMMRPGDIVARYGGDEFVVHMRCNHDVGFRRAREIREAIEACAMDWQDKTLHTTVSVGVYYGSVGHGPNLAEMLAKADAAMYEAKRGGRNNIVEVRESSAA